MAQLRGVTTASAGELLAVPAGMLVSHAGQFVLRGDASVEASAIVIARGFTIAEPRERRPAPSAGRSFLPSIKRTV